MLIESHGYALFFNVFSIFADRGNTLCQEEGRRRCLIYHHYYFRIFCIFSYLISQRTGSIVSMLGNIPRYAEQGLRQIQFTKFQIITK